MAHFRVLFCAHHAAVVYFRGAVLCRAMGRFSDRGFGFGDSDRYFAFDEQKTEVGLGVQGDVSRQSDSASLRDGTSLFEPQSVRKPVLSSSASKLQVSHVKLLL